MRSGAVLAILLLVGAMRPAAQDGPSRFEVASVKPNTGNDLSITYRPPPPDGLTLTNYPLDSIVRYAFDLQDVRIAGLPQWTRESRFDIAARAARPVTEAERRAMLRSLLAERFQVRTHVEPREQTVLVLTTARPDRRLGPGVIRRADCDAKPCISGGGGRPDQLKIGATTMEGLARLLSAMRRQLVYDETGLAGQYDVEMTFRPDDVSPDAADARPAFVSAIEEQLGLKLTSQRRPVDVLVVDSIDRPTPD